MDGPRFSRHGVTQDNGSGRASLMVKSPGRLEHQQPEHMLIELRQAAEDAPTELMRDRASSDSVSVELREQKKALIQRKMLLADREQEVAQLRKPNKIETAATSATAVNRGTKEKVASMPNLCITTGTNVPMSMEKTI